MKREVKFAALLSAAACVTSLPLPAQPQPGSVLWTHGVGSPIVSSPALGADGTVFLGTQYGLIAVTNNGSMASNKWTFSVGVGVNASGSASSPSIAADGTVCFGGNDGKLHAVRPDGSQRWAFQAQGSGGSAAIALDNSIYVVGYLGLNAISDAGAAKWTSIVGGSGNFLSPSVGNGGAIYVGSWDARRFYSFGEDGTTNWSVSLQFVLADSSAIGGDGTIYFTAVHLYAFSSDGTSLWHTTTNDFSGSSPTIARGGTIYVPEATHTLDGVSPSGQVLWRSLEEQGRSDFPATVAAVDAGGTIYYCVSNSIWALNPQGQVQWAVTAPVYPPPGVHYAITSPAIAPDGTLYAALGGVLYAIATGTNGPANSPWPMYRQNPRHTGKVEKPSLQQPKKRSDANFQFQLYAQVGQTQMIQTSTDLATWVPLTNLPITNAPIDVVDLCASNFPSRFYRTVSQ